MSTFGSQLRQEAMTTGDCLSKERHPCCQNKERAIGGREDETSVERLRTFGNVADSTRSTTALLTITNTRTSSKRGPPPDPRTRPMGFSKEKNKSSFSSLLIALFFYLLAHSSLRQGVEASDAISFQNPATSDNSFLEQVISTRSSSASGVPDSVAVTGQLFLFQIPPHAFNGNVTALQVSFVCML